MSKEIIDRATEANLKELQEARVAYAQLLLKAQAQLLEEIEHRKEEIELVQAKLDTLGNTTLREVTHDRGMRLY